MNYLIYIFFAILPSFLWLLFFLSKDKEPESKRAILAIFILGSIMAFFAGIIQLKLVDLFGIIDKKEASLFLFLFYHIIVISFTEEILKYLAVRVTIVNHHEFDEPVDAMIYMITVALGFAAAENFVYFVRYEGLFGETIIHYCIFLGFLRFLGATLLHSLSSAVLGFFMALSFFKIKRKNIIILIGIFSATALHTLYNLFIISQAERGLLLSSALLILLIIFVIYYAFFKLKKMKSICQL